MFIAHCSDKTYVEGVDNLTWDDVPNGISSLQVGTFAGELLTLPKCDKYFYSTEAVAVVPVSISSANELAPVMKPVITAKIVGGILNNLVIYYRIDTRGHINCSIKKIEDLTFTPQTYRTGI